MIKLRLANEQEYEIIQAYRGNIFPDLHIYTDLMSMTQAIEVFDEHPEATHEMVVTETYTDGKGEDKTIETVYKNYTFMVSIQKYPLDDHPNTIRIRMQRPIDA